jgi:phage terminase large subunit-like protein
MAAAKAIHYATMNPNTTTLIISKALRQSMWMFDKIRDMIFSNHILTSLIKIRQGTTRTKIEFKRPINSKIIALPPGNEGETIRGLTANLLIVDEANFIKPQIITSVLMPMITATDGTLIMISTPEYEEHPFMQAFMHSAEWGYTRYHFPSSIAPIPNHEARQKFLQEQQQQIPEEEYQREYLAILPDESNQLIRTQHIHNCIQDYALITEDMLSEHRFHAHIAGYDPGGKQNPAAFVALQQTGITWRLIFIRETIGEEYGTFTAFIKHAHDRLSLSKIAVDATGLGKPITEDLQNLGLPIQAVTITKQTKHDLYTWLTICIEQQKISIPHHDKLIQQLKSIRKQYVKQTDGKTVRTSLEILTPTRTHDDIVTALALALYAAKNQPTPTLIKA